MKKEKYFKKILFFLLCVLVIFFSLVFISIRKSAEFFSILEQEVLNLIKDPQEKISFLMKDLSFPWKELTLKPEKELPAASLVKLPLLAVAFKAIDEGKICLDDLVIIERKDVTGGSGIIKGKKLPLKLTFAKLCELSITYSDNTATNKIIDILGFDYINTGFKELELNHTSLKRKMMNFSKRRKGIDNYTSASDIAFLLEKIYRKRIIGKETSETMLRFLKRQTVADRIPKYLPKEIIVAHKTGLEKSVVHDAGIVFSPRGNYIICVLTKGIKDYRKAKKIIAEVSNLTYNLYQNR